MTEHYVITLSTDGKVTNTVHADSRHTAGDQLVIIYEQLDATLDDTLHRRRLAIAFQGIMQRLWRADGLRVGEFVHHGAQVMGRPNYVIKVAREADLVLINQPQTDQPNQPSQLTNA